jgi:hypothetical protein
VTTQAELWLIAPDIGGPASAPIDITRAASDVSAFAECHHRRVDEGHHRAGRCAIGHSDRDKRSSSACVWPYDRHYESMPALSDASIMTFIRPRVMQWG